MYPRRITMRMESLKEDTYVFASCVSLIEAKPHFLHPQSCEWPVWRNFVFVLGPVSLDCENRRIESFMKRLLEF
jgi:hypothetical protein